MACLALAACDASTVALDQPFTGVDPIVMETARIEIVSGNQQEGTVGESLASPLVVLVTDEAGDGIAQAPVVWTLGQGSAAGEGGSPSEVHMFTDADGQAAIDWQLGTAAGAQSAFAEIPFDTTSTTGAGGAAQALGNDRMVQFSASGGPAQADRIVFSQPSISLQVGQTMEISAAVVDRYGNVIPDAVIRFVSGDSTIVVVTSPTAPMSTQVAELGDWFGRSRTPITRSVGGPDH